MVERRWAELLVKCERALLMPSNISGDRWISTSKEPKNNDQRFCIIHTHSLFTHCKENVEEICALKEKEGRRKRRRNEWCFILYCKTILRRGLAGMI